MEDNDTTAVFTIGPVAQTSSTASEESLQAATKALELANAEIHDARERDKAAQSSDNKGWLYRNINPVMALIVVTFSFCFFLLVLQLNITDPNRKDIAIYLLGGVQSLVITVISYYFGSSKGSSDKARFIEKQSNK